MLRIKKDDTVYVIAGKDKGKTGKVMKVLGGRRVLIEGINRFKKHMRRRREDQQAGVVEVEVPINISNVQLYCKACAKPTRVGVLAQESKAADKASEKKSADRMRICRRCKEVI